MSKSVSSPPAPGLDRRGFLIAGAGGAAAAAVVPTLAHATGVSLSDDLLEIRRAGERLEISWTLNAHVVDEVVSAANNTEVDQAHVGFMPLPVTSAWRFVLRSL